MNKYKEIKTKYEAFGFVESMIAIMIVGISSVVLMQIAVNTMQGIMQNEAIDDMTQYAVEGAEIVQDLAFQNRESEEPVFPASYVLYEGYCFSLTLEDQQVVFKKTDEREFDKFRIEETYQGQEDYKDRNDYRNEAILSEEDYLFRIVCLDSYTGGYGGASDFVVAQIVVGQRYSDGTISRGNLVKDYTYTTVIKL